MDTSLHIGSDDNKSVRSRQNSAISLNHLIVTPNTTTKIPKSDFSKKASVIY